MDQSGRVLRQASAEYPLSTPHPMWSEQDPEDWWGGVQKCLSEIDEVPDAIGVTGQMHGSVFLDADGSVIRPAILWNDQRTVEECNQINDLIGAERVKSITCNPPLTGFQAPKILWLRNHEPEAFSRLRSVLLPKDYIRFRLTGTKATEVSDASGTGLLDVSARSWSPEMLKGLNLDAGLLPKVFESDEISAFTKDGIPVAGGGGDQAAGAVGTGTVEKGIISVSLGTSGVVFTALDSPKYDQSGRAHTFCHANRSWHAMGVMLSCGGALNWYREKFCPGVPFDDIAAEATQIDPGSDGLTFLPYLAGERCPHNDPFAKAAFGGVTLRHRRAHFSRAVFEGISFGLLECLELLKGLGAEVREIRVTSGGAKGKFWVQLLADMFGTSCHTLESDEGPAFGAAILAGVGVGIWPSVATACRETVRAALSTSPRDVPYNESHARYRALYAELRTWNRGIAP